PQTPRPWPSARRLRPVGARNGFGGDVSRAGLLAVLIGVSAAAEPSRSERECAEGKAHACFWLGQSAATGDGRPRDIELALRSLARACELGEKAACEQHDDLQRSLKMLAQLTARCRRGERRHCV